MTKYKDYRDLLKYFFDLKKSKNPRYTLNSFSRDLGLRKGEISDVLNSRYGISLSKANLIAERLGILGSEQGQIFLLLVSAEHGRSLTQKKVARQKLAQIYKHHPDKTIEDRVFEFITQWYYPSLCELILRSDFDKSPSWISNELCISEKEAKLAIENLFSLKLVKEEKGQIVREPYWMTGGDVPSNAIRSHHKNILKKAKQAIDQQDVEKRELSATHFLVKKNQIEKIKEKIRSFRRELSLEFECHESGSDVYCLAMQLFQTTGLNEINGEQE